MTRRFFSSLLSYSPDEPDESDSPSLIVEPSWEISAEFSLSLELILRLKLWRSRTEFTIKQRTKQVSWVIANNYQLNHAFSWRKWIWMLACESSSMKWIISNNRLERRKERIRGKTAKTAKTAAHHRRELISRLASKCKVNKHKIILKFLGK